MGEEEKSEREGHERGEGAEVMSKEGVARAEQAPNAQIHSQGLYQV